MMSSIDALAGDVVVIVREGSRKSHTVMILLMSAQGDAVCQHVASLTIVASRGSSGIAV